MALRGKGDYILHQVDNHNYQAIKDKVSCIIPSYRRCETVARAIDSVIRQTYENIEVCVVDDNNPNDEYSLQLQNLLERYAEDSRVRYIQQKAHINGAAARNAGMDAACGEYIAFLDDDDEWMPTKIEKQIDMLRNNPNVDIVTTLWEIHKNGNLIRREKKYTADNLQYKILSQEVQVGTPTILVRKDAIVGWGRFDESLLRHQDLQFLIVILEKLKCAIVPEYLVKVHIDSDMNIPSAMDLIRIKEEFFRAVQPQMGKYTEGEKKRIRNAHYYQIVYRALREHQLILAMKYVVKAGFHYQSVRDLVRQGMERLKG